MLTLGDAVQLARLCCLQTGGHHPLLFDALARVDGRGLLLEKGRRSRKLGNPELPVYIPTRSSFLFARRNGM